jgi:hypothetical protein
VLCDFRVKWVIRVWSREERLDTKQKCTNGECGTPILLQDVQADATKLVDIWMIEASEEPKFRCDHWVSVREEQFQVEYSIFIRSSQGSKDGYVEVPHVLLSRGRTQPRDCASKRKHGWVLSGYGEWGVGKWERVHTWVMAEVFDFLFGWEARKKGKKRKKRKKRKVKLEHRK